MYMLTVQRELNRFKYNAQYYKCKEQMSSEKYKMKVYMKGKESENNKTQQLKSNMSLIFIYISKF